MTNKNRSSNKTYKWVNPPTPSTPPGYRRVKHSDTKLTPEECSKVNLDSIYCCQCCNSEEISEMIGRNFYSCCACYCCLGDGITELHNCYLFQWVPLETNKDPNAGIISMPVPMIKQYYRDSRS